MKTANQMGIYRDDMVNLPFDTSFLLSRYRKMISLIFNKAK